MAHCPSVSIAGNVHTGKVAIQVIQLRINPTSFLTQVSSHLNHFQGVQK